MYVTAFLLGWIALLGLGVVLFFKTARSSSLKVVSSIILGLGGVWLAIAIISLDSLLYARGKAELHLCMSYLQQMGLGILMYRDDFNGRLPPSLDSTTTRYVPSLQPPTPFVPSTEPPILYIANVHRPTRQTNRPEGTLVSTGSADGHPFYYWPRENLGLRDMLCWDALPHMTRHGILRFITTKQRNVLFADAHVETLEESAFQSLHAKQTGQH